MRDLDWIILERCVSAALRAGDTANRAARDAESIADREPGNGRAASAAQEAAAAAERCVKLTWRVIETRGAAANGALPVRSATRRARTQVHHAEDAARSAAKFALVAFEALDTLRTTR